MRLDVSESRKNNRLWLTSPTIVIVALLVGCSDGAVVVKPEEGGLLPPANPPAIAVEEKQAETISPGQKSWVDPDSLPITNWYAQYLNGKCIGFSQFTAATSETQGNRLLRLTKRDVIEVAATSTKPAERREIVLDSLESADGQFLRYTETSNINDTVSESNAELKSSELVITKTVNGKPTTSILAWPAGTWGPLGTIEVLRAQPMQPNEFREAKVFVPQMDKIVKVEFKSKKWELTTLPDGVVSELLLIETLFVTDAGGSLTKNWVNKAGEIVKSVSEGGFKMFRSTRDEAEQIDGSIRAAQLIDTKVLVRATADQLRTARLTLLIDSTNGDPFGMLSNKVNQQVKSLSALGAALTIHRVTPKDPIPEGVPQDPPDESHRSKFSADTLETSLLQKFLSEISDTTPDASPDILSIASKLTAGVFRKIEKAQLSRQFSTPSQTIKQRAGDCKSHSILLIAALRERGIPARAASGLRIVKDNDSDEIIAIYHMWCEAWMGDRWMPLDPYAGSIGVGVDHIKFLESSLNEENRLKVMLDVLQRMKQLTIAIKP